MGSCKTTSGNRFICTSNTATDYNFVSFSASSVVWLDLDDVGFPGLVYALLQFLDPLQLKTMHVFHQDLRPQSLNVIGMHPSPRSLIIHGQ